MELDRDESLGRLLQTYLRAACSYKEMRAVESVSGLSSMQKLF
ncbi:hypothetical protein [Paenibacillus oryzisoli]|nr:hypothetical protein [Paenibacillus oryzisoli]